MRILLAASEMEPFASTGSFGSEMAELSRELLNLGHQVSVTLPWYREAREAVGSKAKRTGVKFNVPLGPSRIGCTIREFRAPGGLQVFFVERDEFFDRSGLYGAGDGDYQDNAARFIFFSKCVVELAKRLEPAPEIIHAHNWQTGLIPLLAADQQITPRTVLSVPSLEYQGNFWSYDFGLTNLPPHYFSPRGMEYYGSMNLLKTGILFADSVILPGPRLVSAAQLPAHGCGLDPVLREQSRKLEGVWNGLSLGTPGMKSAKAANGTPNAPRLSLLMVTDAMTADGMDLVLPALDRLVESGVRLTVLGKVSHENIAAMEFARRQHAGEMTWHPDCDEEVLSRSLVEADAFLCPASIAPDASILARAIHQGLPPIALTCGGLQQMAPAFSEAGTGFSFPFHNTRPAALVDVVRYAAACKADPQKWSGIVDRARAVDFSWTNTARETEAIYAAVLARFGLLRAA